jgi:ABC-type glutathione transport system ATPase component
MGAKVAAVFADAAAKRAFVQRLLREPEVQASPQGGLLAAARAMGATGYVSQGATLLSGFSVLDNIRFPALYSQPDGEAKFMMRVRLLCRLAAITPHLLTRQTQQMDLLERLQATFLQALAVEPELLVFDNIFEGLGAGEQVRAAGLAETFHRMYPLRCSIYLGYAPPPDQLYRAASVIEESAENL